MKVNTFEGKLILKNKKIAIVISRFNEFLTNKLLSGAVDIIKRHMEQEKDISVFWTPGAFEIPQTVKQVISKGSFDAVVCLAAIVRGDTPHFDYISSEVTKGIAQLGLDSDIPITYGVITADTLEQAIERAGTKAGNKGVEAALSAIELINLYEVI